MLHGWFDMAWDPTASDAAQDEMYVHFDFKVRPAPALKCGPGHSSCSQQPVIVMPQPERERERGGG